MGATSVQDAGNADPRLKPPLVRRGHTDTLIEPPDGRLFYSTFGQIRARSNRDCDYQSQHTLATDGDIKCAACNRTLEMPAAHPICSSVTRESVSMDNQYYVACPHCSAINRIPAARISEHPICGQCKQTLFTGKPIVLTDANFAVHAERSSLPLVVDFWAAWCGPCKMMAPHFDRVAANLEPEVRLAKLDTDANPATASRFNIRSIPTLILFKNGREAARQSGAMDANMLSNWIRGNA